MFRRSMIVFAAVLFVIGFSIASVAAQTNEGVCTDGKPTHQVRFLNFNDIPIYTTEADALKAFNIFTGVEEAAQIPQPTVRVPGGNRQKYLFCGKDTPGDGTVKIVFGSRLYYAPENLVESIVPRNWRDAQSA